LSQSINNNYQKNTIEIERLLTLTLIENLLFVLACPIEEKNNIKLFKIKERNTQLPLDMGKSLSQKREDL